MIAFEYIDLQIIFKEIARELIHSIKTLDAKGDLKIRVYILLHYTIYSICSTIQQM